MKKFWNFDLLHIAKFSFWVLTVLISLSFISLIILGFPSNFYLEQLGLIVPSEGMDSELTEQYSTSLSFLFIIISFFSVVMIFLFQHINSTYNTEELEKPPIFVKYFVGILGVLLFYSFFNLCALYFKLGPRYEFMSFVYSVSLIFLIPIKIIFAYYNTRPSIILGIISEDIIKFIRKNKKFKKVRISEERYSKGEVSYSEEFIKELNEKISIFIKNSKRALKNDQDMIFTESLKNIRKICREYLRQSKHIIAVEDKFLDELNDHFNFIIDEGLNSSNQKILEDIAKTIGEISKDSIRYRKEIGYKTFVLNWISTLKSLFLKSYHKDRTKTCHICLDEINKVALLALHEGCYESYHDCVIYIDEISEILSKISGRWSSVLLQRILHSYGNQSLKLLDLLKKKRITFEEIRFKRCFRRIAELINIAKTIRTSLENKVIFSSLYGIDSFAQKIAKTDLRNIQDYKIKKEVSAYMKEFINFNYNVIKMNSEKNDFIVYESFAESLFLLTKCIDLEENDEKILINILSNNLLECIKERYLNGLKEQPFISYEITEYLALLIYLHHEKVGVIKEVIQNLVNLYNQIKKELKNENRRALISLYKELKLYSCWVSIFPKLKDANKPLIELLITDFNEPPPQNGYLPLLKQYGYTNNIFTCPRGPYGSPLWALHPSQMWTYTEFNDEISEKLNGPEGKNYIEFHEMLKSKQQEKQNKKIGKR